MEIVYTLASLLFVFCLFAILFCYNSHQRSSKENMKKQMEIIARKVIDDYGRQVAREEARKLHN